MALPLVIASQAGWTTASAQTPEIVVAGEAGSLASGQISSSDTASLLSSVDSAQAGGISSLPMLHGLGDDRIRILVNGVPMAAACPMHMNPPLSCVTAYFTAVQNYIGVLPLCAPACSGMPASQLIFANQRARLYGRM